jgi:hypothetical protein
MRNRVINMEEAKLQTLAQIKAFLDGTTEAAFRVSKEARNQFIKRVFKRFGYTPRMVWQIRAYCRDTSSV